MLQPKNDPFFEQLKADVQEGIKDADEGRLVSAKQVREHFRMLSKELCRQRGDAKE
jgi:predicted transcriptional regulator